MSHVGSPFLPVAAAKVRDSLGVEMIDEQLVSYSSKEAARIVNERSAERAAEQLAKARSRSTSPTQLEPEATQATAVEA